MTPDIYKDILLLLPENIAHKIENNPNQPQQFFS